MTSQQLQNKISKAFEQYFGITSAQATSLVQATANAAGKVYEAYVLALVARDLVTQEGCTLRLSSGSKIKLKSSPGPINRSYPYIEVYRHAALLGEIWTDVEFSSLSYSMNPHGTLGSGDCHELDILMALPGATKYPSPGEILLGVECKDTPYRRRLLREILGVRRELSLLAPPQPTAFQSWPRSDVPADPASCLLVYSSSAAITAYAAPGVTFGIDFKYEPI